MKTLDRFLLQRDVNLFAKLFEVGDAGRIAAYAEDLLSKIAQRAPRQKDELRRTLLVYFDNQHNIKRTAETLGLHINTVRQRLDTLREITGGWSDPVRALELHVALRLRTILE
jgi:DNA-binding PucR family transcriptional regulator